MFAMFVYLEPGQRYIEILAEDLFKTGSPIGHLLFITYFYKVLDVKFVMFVLHKRSWQSLTDQQFDKQTPMVLNALKQCEDPTKCSTYLSYMISCSPSVLCLWKLHTVVSDTFPPQVVGLKDEFSLKYCKFISYSRTTKPDLLQPRFWSEVPNTLKNDAATPFCKALDQQLERQTLQTEWSKERIASLRTIVLDTSLQSSEYFHQFVSRVLTSSQRDIGCFLPDLLTSETFLLYWLKEFSEDEKYKFCRHCLEISYQYGGEKPKVKVLNVVVTWTMLRETEALKSNKQLCEALDKEAERLVMRTKLETIMEAFKDAQNHDPPVQERLTLLFRNSIKHRSGKGDIRSRYRQMIRILGFESSKEREKKDLHKIEVDRWV